MLGSGVSALQGAAGHVLAPEGGGPRDLLSPLRAELKRVVAWRRVSSRRDISWPRHPVGRHGVLAC